MSSKKDMAGDRLDASPPLRSQAARPAGPENLGRLKSNLWRNAAATQYLFDRGLSAETIRKFHLGMKEPYRRKSDGQTVSGVLCYPMISHHREPLGRYGYYAIPGVTENPPDEDGWGPGKPTTYYSGDVAGKSILLVAASCRELWALDQHLEGTEFGRSVVVIAPSHGSGLPVEWKKSEFWAGWAKVIFVHSDAVRHTQTPRVLIRHCGREVFRARVPENMGHCWTEFFLAGGSAEQFIELLKTAPAFSDPTPKSSGPRESVGDFGVNAVNINGAFVNDHLYYPFTIERREVEKVERVRGGGGTGRLVASYVTKVVRSDGAVLDVVKLAAPRGTPRERQVLALTDGTRIEKEPQFSHYATWQFDSIQAFINAAQHNRPAPHRPLKELIAEVVAHLRRSVWLPYEDDYTVLALYAAMSFVYQVFDAIPLLIVRGEKGTGKSELGDAISKVSCNATVIGQGSSASVVRLLNEARGLVVLDDLESVGRVFETASFGDINQMLKLSYKKRTGRKAITDKSGKITIFDFYGPKIITNTRGVDPILGSRMLHIQTRRMPDAIRHNISLPGSEADELMQLRNDLHMWGMVNARNIHEHYLRLTENITDRQQEICTPLRAIASLSGDDALRNSLETAIRRQSATIYRLDDPVEMLKEAVGNCIRQGATRHLSAAQLRLEIGLIANQSAEQAPEGDLPPWMQPEWIGKTICDAGIRNLGVKVKRVRLYGIIIRIYELREDYVRVLLGWSAANDAQIPVEKKPLSFCEEIRCEHCPYEHVCQSIMPGLKAAKQRDRGRRSPAAATGQLSSSAVMVT
jgi:hypothetical protein